MNKTALKLAGAAIAVPILLGGMALPANATVAPPPGTAAKPAPDVFIGLPKNPVAKLPDVFPGLPKSPAKAPKASGVAMLKSASAGTSVHPALAASTAIAFKAVRAQQTWLGAGQGDIKYNSIRNTATRKFKNGYIVGATGHSHAVAVKPAIHAAYLRYENSKDQALREPTANERTIIGSVATWQHFVFGDIYWSPKGGAHRVIPEATWKKHGGITGRLGYPTSDWTKDGTKKFYQTFKGGKIVQDTSKGSGPKSFRVIFNKK
jgi:hypothetical protein